MNSLSPPSAAKSFVIAAVAFAGMAFAVLPGNAFAETPDKDPLIARVNGVELRQSDLTVAREDLGRSIPSEYSEAETRDAVVAYMTDLVLLSEEAKKRKVGDESDLRRRMQYVRNKTLRDNLLAKEARDSVTEAAVRAAFDEAARAMTADKQLHIRGMVFAFATGADESAVSAAEAKAKAALERLQKGEDFAAVARDTADTKDVRGKIGGDMGFMGRTQMGKEYADVAYTLKDGEFSSPIKTAFGWHIIKVESRRDAPSMEFAKVRERFAEFVARQAQSGLLGKLRSTAKVERLDKSPNSAEAGANTKAN